MLALANAREIFFNFSIGSHAMSNPTHVQEYNAIVDGSQ